MKKILLFNILAIFAIVAIFQLSSCSKDSTTTSAAPTVKEKTTKEKLLGAWLSIEQASDNNQDGTISGNEIRPTPSTEEHTYTYTDDGKLTLHTVATAPYAYDTTIVYSWELRNNDQSIFISSNTPNDTATVNITTLTDTDFEYSTTIYVNSMPIKGWTKMKRK